MGGSVSAPASRSAGASPLAGCELLDDRSMVVLPIGFAHATRARSQRRNLAFLEQLGRQGLTASWVAVDDLAIKGDRASLAKAHWKKQHEAGKARLSLINFERALRRCASDTLAWAQLCVVVEDDTVLHPAFAVEAK